MNKETLERATELSNDIDTLKGHIKNIMYFGSGTSIDYSDENHRVEIKLSEEGTNPRRLHIKYLPYALPDMVELYIKRVEEEIAKLEAELEAL